MLASTATKLQAQLVAHVALHLEKFVLAQHAVVDEDAGEPIADGAFTSTAATEESTPPERAQMAWPSPTCSRIAATVDWMNWAGVQLGSAWQMRKRKLRSNSVPLGVCRTSG